MIEENDYKHMIEGYKETENPCEACQGTGICIFVMAIMFRIAWYAAVMWMSTLGWRRDTKPKNAYWKNA